MDEHQKAVLEEMAEKQRGSAIIDGKQDNFRQDGYTNLLNKYGTKQDNSTAYKYEQEPIVSDMELIKLYEGNGLFTKIIDRPAEEAVKHGFDIDYGDEDIAEYVDDCMDELDFEEKFATAEKWARLYGGAIIVMLVNDGRGLEEPLAKEDIGKLEELRVFERAVVQPDYSGMYQFGMMDITSKRKFGEPEYYQVFSTYGYFTVHRSRCLVFRNGRLPEQTTNALYRYWGIPEYVKIKNALRECITAHGNGVKLLERSVQAIYKMKNLANMLSTEDGENKVLTRLQVIDMARGILNSIAIDNDGEDYDFKTLPMSGVREVIDTTCNMLSAVTNIPQTILFGRSPAGMNATGDSDLENYYNLVENIQKQNMKANTRTVIDRILQYGAATGEIPTVPKYKMKFAALWSLSEIEQANIDQTKAQTEYIKAQTAQIYMESNAIDPSEVRKSLASEGAFEIEEVLSEEDLNIPDDTFGELETQEPGKQILGTKDVIELTEVDPDQNKDDDFYDLNDEGKVIEVIENDEESMNLSEITIQIDGGPGSGNWGHSGRPGKIGGSGKGGGKQHRTGTKETGFSSAAKEQKKSKSFVASNRVKPSVKSPKEFDEYVKRNDLDVLHRGYSASSKEKEEQYAESIKNGTSPMSGKKTSGLGEGVYFTSSKEEAEGYMVRRKSETGDKYGRVTTVALEKGAKVADWEKLNLQKAKAEAEAIEKALDAKEKGASREEVNKLKDKYYELQEMSLSDYAISKGYDASYHQGEKTTIVYNQNALVVRNDSMLNDDVADYPAAAVIILKDGKILCAFRRDGKGVCGAGGHAEEGETPQETAIREAQEEFGVTPHNLIPLGEYKGNKPQYLPSMIYFTDQFTGEPKADGSEMYYECWFTLEQLRYLPLFPPFEASLDLLENFLGNYLTISDSTDTITIETNFDGGPGSGNFGHGGRPGKVGGSSGGEPSGGNRKTSGSNNPNINSRKISLSAQEKAKITERLKGKQTKDGVVITSVSEHAFERLGGRKISPGRAESIITTGIPGPGNTDRTTVYDYPGSRAVVDNKTGKVVTFMWRGKNK